MKTKLFLTSIIVALLAVTGSAQSLEWSQYGHPDSLQVNGVSFSADGQKVLSGSSCHPAAARLYDVANGNITWDHVFDSVMYCMMGVGISANGKYLATVEEMGNIVIFDYSQGTPDSVMTINIGTPNAFSLCFAPNSKKLAVGGSNGRLKTYFLSNGAKHIDLIAHAAWVSAVTYSPNNLRIGTASNDDKAKVWDTLGTLVHTLNGHTGDVTSIKFTVDNAKILTGSRDNTVKIWDNQTGALLQTIPVSNADVNALDVSPFGHYFVTVSGDDTVRIWSLANYSKIASFAQSKFGMPVCVAWSPVGNRIVMGTINGKVVMFNADAFTGIEQAVSAMKLPLYPNPCTDKLTIGLAAGTRHIEIADLNGKLVFNADVPANKETLELNTSCYAPGVYYARLRSAAGIVTFKFLKQ